MPNPLSEAHQLPIGAQLVLTLGAVSKAAAGVNFALGAAMTSMSEDQLRATESAAFLVYQLLEELAGSVATNIPHTHGPGCIHATPPSGNLPS